MNRIIRQGVPYFLLFPALLIARGATVPPMEITVTNAANKVVYKGTTRADGSFATGNLESGNYVVEFGSKAKMTKGSKFALSAAAGKYTANAESVSGEKFVDPGVAMRVTVPAPTKITGQVAIAGTLPKQTAQTSANGKGTAKKWNGPVKVVDGKRYIWVLPNTGSVAGGHWVEEGSPEAIQAEGDVTVRQGNQPPVRSYMSGRY